MRLELWFDTSTGTIQHFVGSCYCGFISCTGWSLAGDCDLALCSLSAIERSNKQDLECSIRRIPPGGISEVDTHYAELANHRFSQLGKIMERQAHDVIARMHSE